MSPGHFREGIKPFWKLACTLSARRFWATNSQNLHGIPCIFDKTLFACTLIKNGHFPAQKFPREGGRGIKSYEKRNALGTRRSESWENFFIRAEGFVVNNKGVCRSDLGKFAFLQQRNSYHVKIKHELQASCERDLSCCRVAFSQKVAKKKCALRRPSYYFILTASTIITRWTSSLDGGKGHDTSKLFSRMKTQTAKASKQEASKIVLLHRVSRHAHRKSCWQLSWRFQ